MTGHAVVDIPAQVGYDALNFWQGALALAPAAFIAVTVFTVMWFMVKKSNARYFQKLEKRLTK